MCGEIDATKNFLKYKIPHYFDVWWCLVWPTLKRNLE